eukprot:2726098-Amphidinium_carterae.1
MAGPMKILGEVVRKIAGRELGVTEELKPHDLDSATNMVENQVPGAHSCTPDSDESESEMSSGEETKRLVAEVVQGTSRGFHDWAVEYDVYQHQKYGTYHLRRKLSTDLNIKFLCGRVDGAQFELLSSLPEVMVPTCSTCFSHVP